MWRFIQSQDWVYQASILAARNKRCAWGFTELIDWASCLCCIERNVCLVKSHAPAVLLNVSKITDTASPDVPGHTQGGACPAPVLVASEPLPLVPTFTKVTGDKEDDITTTFVLLNVIAIAKLNQGICCLSPVDVVGYAGVNWQLLWFSLSCKKSATRFFLLTSSNECLTAILIRRRKLIWARQIQRGVSEYPSSSPTVSWARILKDFELQLGWKC